MMEYSVTADGISVRAAKCFDLKNTFECGQCFRWNEGEDGSYSGIVRGRELKVSANGEEVILHGCTEEDYREIWEDYFDLNTVYDDIRTRLVADCPQLQCAVDSINGIRILSQEPWEALCSFIISQNNNIPRIKGIVTRLCENFGEKCGSGYSFPSAEAVSALSVEDLAPLRSGFRAKYILDAAQKVACGEVELEKMRTAPIADCRSELMKIKGVGAKVAECTLLYGLHRLEAFPVDVWMKKALSGVFSSVDIASLGSYAGIAQQYIFHYMRITSQGS